MHRGFHTRSSIVVILRGLSKEIFIHKDVLYLVMASWAYLAKLSSLTCLLNFVSFILLSKYTFIYFCYYTFWKYIALSSHTAPLCHENQSSHTSYRSHFHCISSILPRICLMVIERYLLRDLIRNILIIVAFTKYNNYSFEKASY